MEAGAHEASKRDEKHGKADDEEWRLQNRGACRVGALGQPEPCPDDRYRGEERPQVEVADHHIAEAVRIHLVAVPACSCCVLGGSALGLYDMARIGAGSCVAALLIGVAFL